MALAESGGVAQLANVASCFACGCRPLYAPLRESISVRLAPAVMPLAMIQGVPGTRTRSSAFFGPQMNSSPLAGPQLWAEAGATSQRENERKTASRIAWIIILRPLLMLTTVYLNGRLRRAD